MDGAIELDSQPGETVFTLLLPLSDTPISHEMEPDLSHSRSPMAI
jgi:nitrogen-specific signal transduction histidine kinase